MYASESVIDKLEIATRLLFSSGKFEDNFMVKLVKYITFETLKKNDMPLGRFAEIISETFRGNCQKDGTWNTPYSKSFRSVRDEVFDRLFRDASPLGHMKPGESFKNDDLISALNLAVKSFSLPKYTLEATPNGGEYVVHYNNDVLPDESGSILTTLGFRSGAISYATLTMQVFANCECVANFSPLKLLGLGFLYICPKNAQASKEKLEKSILSIVEVAEVYSTHLAESRL